MADQSLRVEFNGRIFGYRVAGIAVHDGKLLLHRSSLGSMWALPGGACHFGEDARSSLVREIREELGVDARVNELAFVIENFLTHEGKSWHEIGLYFRFEFVNSGVGLYQKDEFIGLEDLADLFADVDHELRFRWVPISELESIDFRPGVLKGRMTGTNQQPVYLTQFDGRS